MNRQLVYKIAKVIPKPIRNVIKIFYNPIIPMVSKLDYGEDINPEETNFLCSKLKEVLDNRISGDIIEFGVYRGGTTLRMAKILINSLKKNNKIIYGLDTFKGLPEHSDKDNVNPLFEDAMNNNDINKVKDVFIKNKVNDKVILMRGLFSESIPKLLDKRFCFVYIDCDLYEGTKEALEYSLPRMSEGGIIFIDDYASKSWEGVKKAVLEFLKEEEIDEFKNKAYWIKK